MDYVRVGKNILQLVGGEKNVKLLTHCATRLRFVLKDASTVQEAKLKNAEGVFGVAKGGGQFQIIIGSEVEHVYRAILGLGNFDFEKSDGTNQSSAKKGFFTNVLDFIAGSFTPILPAITGAGMIKAVLALLTAFKPEFAENTTYLILEIISDGAFYFLPIMLAYTSAQKLKSNSYIAMAIAAVLVHPNLSALFTTHESVTFLGLPVRNVSYGSSVIPILLAVILMSFVEKFADKVSPKAVKFFLKPLLIVLIVTPITLLILGPIGGFIGDYMVIGVNFISNKFNWLAVFLLGTFSPLLVMFGMHYAFFPVMMNSFSTLGYEGLMVPGMLTANVAQGGAALAVSVKSKDRKIKEMARSTGITGVMGITEPAMYGINLKYKTPFIGVMAGGGAGGLFAGITGVKAFAMASPGLAALPIFIGDTFIYAVISIIIAVVVSFAVTYIIYKDPVSDDGNIIDVTEPSLETSRMDETILSPLKGEIKNLKEVNDSAFSEEVLGKGIAIQPTEGKLFSPVNGTVTAIFHTKHAIGITSEAGAEILIHIGLDTVKLEGRHFNSHVQQGSTVKAGELLIDFDVAAIKAEGYDLITPILITNTQDYSNIAPTGSKNVNVKDTILLLSI